MSQYILQSLFSSGNLNDVKAAIPLLKGIDERLSLPNLKYQTMNTSYESEAIYDSFIEWANNQSLSIINEINRNLSVLINILRQLVLGNIPIDTTVMIPNMKH